MFGRQSLWCHPGWDFSEDSRACAHRGTQETRDVKQQASLFNRRWVWLLPTRNVGLVSSLVTCAVCRARPVFTVDILSLRQQDPSLWKWPYVLCKEFRCKPVLSFIVHRGLGYQQNVPPPSKLRLNMTIINCPVSDSSCGVVLNRIFLLRHQRSFSASPGVCRHPHRIIEATCREML